MARRNSAARLVPEAELGMGALLEELAASGAGRRPSFEDPAGARPAGGPGRHQGRVRRRWSVNIGEIPQALDCG